MSDLPSPFTPDLLAEMQDLTVEELKAILVRGLRIVAEELLRCACAVHFLEAKGEDFSDLKIGLLNHLRKIACGQLLPEVVVYFQDSPDLIVRIGSLPIADQRRLADGEHILTLVPDVHLGGYTQAMLDPRAMRPNHIKQVFARDHIRTEGEQAAWLHERHEKARMPVPESVGKLKIDNERGGVVVGRHFVPWSDLETALRFKR